MGLSISDQTFIQQMMCSKALSDTKTVETYNMCLAKAKGNRSIKARDIEAVTGRMNRINDTLSPLGFQFKTIYSPWENTVFWGLCNTLEDAAVPLSSTLKKNENAAFFDLIEVLQDEDGLIPLVVAHGKVSKTASIPIVEAANLIQKLNQHKWLKIIKKQSGAVNVSFGARTLLEIPRIRSWLMRRNREVGDAAKAEDEEEEEEEEIAELAPDDEIQPNPRPSRGRKSSRRVVENDDEDDEMEIEPAPIVRRSKRARE